MIPRLMLVTDAARSRRPLLELVVEAVAGGVDAVYVRGALTPQPPLPSGWERGNLASGGDAEWHDGGGPAPPSQRTGPGTLWVAVGGEGRSGEGSSQLAAELIQALHERIGNRATLLVNDPALAEAAGVGLHLRERDPLPVDRMSGRGQPGADSGEGRDSSRSLGMTANRGMPPEGGMTPPGRPLLVGRSVHSAEEAARSGGVDYVLAGHVYPSTSKPGKPPLGLEGLRAIVAAAPCPVVAIGGITAERVTEVIAAGARGVAVIGAIAEADDPRAAAMALRAALDQALWQQGARSDD